MGRWEPDAAGRFRTAAMDLFLERGFEATTVADIAERAGLTRRTFFRHFADKREVLFHGSERLQQAMVEGLRAAPAEATPFEAVRAALDVTVAFFGDHRDFARQRWAVISAHAELRERELIKFATLSSALAAALRARCVVEPDASLAAEAAMAVFRVAFETWVADGEARSYAEIIDASMTRLRVLAGDRRAA